MLQRGCAAANWRTETRGATHGSASGALRVCGGPDVDEWRRCRFWRDQTAPDSAREFIPGPLSTDADSRAISPAHLLLKSCSLRD